MVLHVAAAGVLLRVEVLEFAEDVPRRLADDVREHVQTPPVGHAEDDLHRALGGDLLDRQVEQGDQALGALEREALRAKVLLLDELLEHGGVDQLSQDPDLLATVQVDPVAADLHPFLEPGADLQVVDVHELGADVLAVGVAHPLPDFAHRRRVGAGDAGGGHGAVEVAFLDAQALEFQFLREHRWIAERVDVREEMATDPVVADHVVDPALEFDVARQGGSRSSGGFGCPGRLGRCRGSGRGRRRGGDRRRGRPVAAEQRRRLERRLQGSIVEFPGRGQGVEVVPPLLVEGRRVAAVLGQEGFDVVEGEAVQLLGLAHRCLPP